MAIKIVEQCSISPSDGGEQLLPLLHFDVVWLPVQPSQLLYFYDSPSSTQHFSDTIVPTLKNSLSLALKHFLPLAGKLVFPLNSGMPVSHYSPIDEDSVSLTIAVSDSDSDFFLLTGNHPRDADDFHDFIPQMPPAAYSSDSIKFPAAAIRVTLFPNQGICIGLAVHHAISDGTSIIDRSGFIPTWASINSLKLKGDSHPPHKLTLPTYDRSIVQDANTLTSLFWNHVKMLNPAPSSTISLPMFKVRATFVLTGVEIQGLRAFLINQNPAVPYVSSYVIVCALVWSCLAASAAAAGERVDEDEAEYLSMYVDCRKRLIPPLPDTYFGNCLRLVLAQSTHGSLRGLRKPGFLAAARAIGAAIKRSVDNGGGILDGAEEEYLRRFKLAEKRMIGVSGSPRFDQFAADFGLGLGGLRKLEALHIDYNGSIFLSKSKGGGGGVEISLSMAKLKMDAFAAIFNNNYWGAINSTL